MNEENNEKIKIEEEDKKLEEAPVRLVVGVQYRCAGKIYTFETKDEGLLRGDYVVVEGEYDESVGYVIVPPRSILADDLPKNLKKILRRAKETDIEEDANKNEKAFEIFELFKQKAEEHKLDMKPLDAHLTEKGKKVVLNFFSEERVDFRSLVKELASKLHMRIEMRQVGARDEVKTRGWIGICGRETCCAQHLRQFRSISIQMAKIQGLMPNPAKLTGCCGKLKCCLAYEKDTYQEIRKELPRLGSLVVTSQGDGKIVSFNILKKEGFIRLDDGGELRLPVKDIKLKREQFKNEKTKELETVKEEKKK